MKANELRIGNYVYHDALKIPRLGIDGVDYMQITGEGISCFEQKLMDVIPIPLTEEWLLKFGCEKNTFSDFDSYFEYWIIPNKNFFFYVVTKASHTKTPYLSCMFDEAWFIKVFDCFYVHTLQNAFALTGEELTIKL